MSDYTELPRNIADCMSRAGSPLSEDQKLLLAGYLAPVQQRLSDCEARVVELEGQFHVKQLASLMRGLEVKPVFGSMPPEGFYALGRAIADQAKAATEPAILRKQAEAVAPAIRTALRNLGNAGLSEDDIADFAESYAQRLRQQADEAERAGGE